jgi:tetratricopeptide (TPR) repeat protein
MAVFRETQNGSASTTATQASSLFISSPSHEIWTLGSTTTKRHTRYQQAIYALLARARYLREGIESFYISIAVIAAQAHAERDIEALDLASQIMLALPVSRRRKNLAHCYQSLCRTLRGEFELARERLDQLLEEEQDPRLRSRALVTKAASYFDADEIDQSLPFYVEGGRVARDCEPAGLIESMRMVAVIKSFHGDHHESLSDLENLLPIAFRISTYDPKLYPLLLNSIAVELGEIGRVDEALKVSSVVINSPLASSYPEFHQAHAELESKQATKKRSVVVIHRQAESDPKQQVECINRSTRREHGRCN